MEQGGAPLQDRPANVQPSSDAAMLLNQDTPEEPVDSCFDENGVDTSMNTVLRTQLKTQRQQLKAARAKTSAVLQQLLASRQHARQACLNLDALRQQQHLPRAPSSLEFEKFDQIVEELERCIQQEPKAAEERQWQQERIQCLMSLLHEQMATDED